LGGRSDFGAGDDSDLKYPQFTQSFLSFLRIFREMGVESCLNAENYINADAFNV